MQLQALLTELRKISKKLSYERRNVERAGQTYWVYSGLAGIRSAMGDLERLDLLTQIRVNVMNLEMTNHFGGEVTVDPRNGTEFEKRISQAQTVVEELKRALVGIVGESDENSIEVKLEGIVDFQDLSIASRDLQTIFSQVVVNDEIGGHVKIQSVENGSIWLSVGLGSRLAAALIGAIAKVALSIQEKIYSNRILAQKARMAKMEADRMDFLASQEKQLIAFYAEVESEHLKAEFFKNPDAEISGRIKNSILLMQSLMDKGTEVRPSLSAPQEVKDAFPSDEMEKVVANKRLASTNAKELPGDPEDAA